MRTLFADKGNMSLDLIESPNLRMDEAVGTRLTTVLLVEDNPDDAHLLQEVLAHAAPDHFILLHAETLHVAWQRLSENAVDVVLLDLALPDSRGLTTIAKVTQAAPSVPIVVLTGVNNETLALEALRMGAQDYLIKGQVDGRTVERVIRYAIQRKRAEEQLKQLNADLGRNQLELMQALSDLKKSHEELKSIQWQLIEAEKMESVGRLAAGVAHEVKNPLAILSMGVEILTQRGVAKGKDEGQLLSNMVSAISKADAVISQLQEFSVPRDAEMKNANLNEVLEKSLALIKHELDRFQITLSKDLGEGLSPLWLDHNKIQQLFVNIFMNAVQAMPEGGTLFVRTFARQAQPAEVIHDVGDRKGDRFRVGDPVVIVEVQDTGIGIAEDKLSKVFDPFYTSKPTGQGTGLGLTVARKIVEMHSGTISVKNHKNGGVCVTTVFKG
jgi:signal transduction histidine kinase